MLNIAIIIYLDECLSFQITVYSNFRTFEIRLRKLTEKPENSFLLQNQQRNGKSRFPPHRSTSPEIPMPAALPVLQALPGRPR
jgi:hypothetical protein